MPPVYTLIADDDTKRVQSTLQALRGLQTGVLVASDGQQALNLIQRFGPPQLLIVDLGLATRDAFSVMNALRTSNAAAEILAWTPGRDLASLATARLSTLQVRPLRPGIATDVLHTVLARALERARGRAAAMAARVEADVRRGEDLLKRIADDAQAVSGTPGVAVYLMTPTDSKFHALVTWTGDAQPPQSPYYMPQIFEWVSESGEPLIFPDLTTDHLPFAASSAIRDAVRGLAAVPIVTTDAPDGARIAGAICVFDVKPLGVGHETLERLIDVGRTALAEGSSSSRVVHDGNALDDGDGSDWRNAVGPLFLRGRAALWAAAREWARARRQGTPLSVVVVVLEEREGRESPPDHILASVLGKTARQSDLAFMDRDARDLVLVLPDTPEAAARVVAERVRGAIQVVADRVEPVAAAVTAWDGHESFESLLGRVRSLTS